MRQILFDAQMRPNEADTALTNEANLFDVK